MYYHKSLYRKAPANLSVGEIYSHAQIASSLHAKTGYAVYEDLAMRCEELCRLKKSGQLVDQNKIDPTEFKVQVLPPYMPFKGIK